MNCTELLTNIDSYVAENFKEICQTKDFLRYPCTFIKELISKDDLNIDDEKKVLEAILNWVKNSLVDRESELPDLMRRIRMTLIEEGYLAKITVSEELFRTSIRCRDLIDEAKNYNSHPELRKSVCSFTTEPRQLVKTTNISEDEEASRCFYKLNTELKCTTQHFNLTEKKWYTKQDMLFYVNNISVVEVENKMCFFHWGDALQYDPENDQYKMLAEVPTPTILMGTESLNNKVYMCGGKIGNTASNAVKCFNPEKDKWTRVRSMPTRRWGASAVAFSGYIFVIGGRDGYATLDSVERYSPVTDKWKTMLPLLTKRCQAGAAVLNGKIYVCGGNTLPAGIKGITATAEDYDPVKNRWESISASMNIPRSQFTLLAYCGKLYAVGGTDNTDTHINDFDVYDPESDEWTCIQTTGNELFTSGAVVLPNIEV